MQQNGDTLRAEFLRIHKKNVRSWDPWPDAPWEVSSAGRAWAVTTDGHVMVAVHRELMPSGCLPPPASVGKKIEEWLTIVSTAPSTVNAGALKAFCRVDAPVVHCEACDNKREIDCTECEGTGEFECECDECGHEHTAECAECDGHGKVNCKACSAKTKERAVRFLGRVVNAGYLKDVLTTVRPDDAEDLHVSTEALAPNQFAYLLRPASDSSWMAMVMEMKPDTKADESYPPVDELVGASPVPQQPKE